MHMKRLLVAGVTGMLFALILAACSSKAAGPAPEVGVVVGNRANSAPLGAANLSANLVSDWVAEGAVVSVVVPDGQPGLVATLDLAATGPNALYRTEMATAQTHRALTSLLTARATSPQADTLGAITLAARAVIGGGGARRVVVFDSGLSTVAPLAFQNGVLYDTPQAVVSFLRVTDELPDLHGVAVTWYGLGQVSAPQQPLTAAEQNRLAAIWSAVLDAAGARSVDIVSTPLAAAPQPSGLPVVSTVPVQPATSLVGHAPSTQPGLVVNLGPSAVHFVPNEATYLDPSHAEAVLAVVAHEIEAGGYHQVTLTGTTALPPGITLSKARAEAVADTLVADGVPASEITTVGAGEHFPGFVNDISPTGVFEPAPANEDRLVIVTASR